MVSHDLPRSTVTKQIAFDQRDLHSTPVFERAMDRHCQALVSKLETVGPSVYLTDFWYDFEGNFVRSAFLQFWCNVFL